MRKSTLGNFSLRTTGSKTNQEKEREEKERVKREKKEKKRQGQRIRKSVFGSEKSRKDSDHNLHWNLTSRPTSIENSQAWKDLFRDTININGDIINGGVEGPEAMIGSLVRHILLQVQKMRENWVSYRQQIDIDDNIDTSRMSNRSEQEVSFERARMLASTYADLDEGQALSIARDVLLSCNRTESGGDTYYCVQALLCNSNFAVLTPHGCAVDPIDIVVDVVESFRKKTRRPRSHGDDSSTTHSTPSKEQRHPYHHHHHLSGITEVVTPRDSDNVDDENCGGLRDSTTVESDSSSSDQVNGDTKPVLHSHYPESLLNAAAAQVKQRGRHVGDIDDYYDPAELVLQSDIPGAAALPSNMLLLKEVSKRKKQLSQPGYIERSDSENSIDFSEDSASNNSEKDYNEKSRAQLEMRSVESGTRNQNAYVTPPNRPTPVFQINCDDATIAMSELTMESAHSKSRRKNSMPSMLRKNLGMGDDDLPSPATQKKRHSFFSWSSNKDPEPTPLTPSGGSQNSNSIISPPPKARLSWRISKKNDDDTNSVTDVRHPSIIAEDEEEEEEEETAAQSMCIRIQVIVKSRYRLCNLDPQDEHEDTWANITGQFHQNFFLKSNSNGRPAVSDRFVTVKVDDPTVGY
jgi:hypothetical protein